MHGNQHVYPLKKLEHLIPNITFAPEIRSNQPLNLATLY